MLIPESHKDTQGMKYEGMCDVLLLIIGFDSQWQAKGAVDIDKFAHPSVPHYWS